MVTAEHYLNSLLALRTFCRRTRIVVSGVRLDGSIFGGELQSVAGNADHFVIDDDGKEITILTDTLRSFSHSPIFLQSAAA